MDQLEVGLLGAQLVTLAMGIHIVNSGTDEAGPPRPGEPLAVRLHKDLLFLVLTARRPKHARSSHQQGTRLHNAADCVCVCGASYPDGAFSV